MFKKILSANRGEIALRVMRCGPGRMGIGCCPRSASNATANAIMCAWQTNLSASARLLAANPTVDSVDHRRVRNSPGAEAIHPGYALFLSETTRRGLCADRRRPRPDFIGTPQAAHIRSHGRQDHRQRHYEQGLACPASWSDGRCAHWPTPSVSGEEIGYSGDHQRATRGWWWQGHESGETAAENGRAFRLPAPKGKSNFRQRRSLYREYLTTRATSKFRCSDDGKVALSMLANATCSLATPPPEGSFEEAPGPSITAGRTCAYARSVQIAMANINYMARARSNSCMKNGDSISIEMKHAFGRSNTPSPKHLWGRRWCANKFAVA